MVKSIGFESVRERAVKSTLAGRNWRERCESSRRRWSVTLRGSPVSINCQEAATEEELAAQDVQHFTNPSIRPLQHLLRFPSFSVTFYFYLYSLTPLSSFLLFAMSLMCEGS